MIMTFRVVFGTIVRRVRTFGEIWWMSSVFWLFFSSVSNCCRHACTLESTYRLYRTHRTAAGNCLTTQWYESKWASENITIKHWIPHTVFYKGVECTGVSIGSQIEGDPFILSIMFDCFIMCLVSMSDRIRNCTINRRAGIARHTKTISPSAETMHTMPYIQKVNWKSMFANVSGLLCTQCNIHTYLYMQSMLQRIDIAHICTRLPAPLLPFDDSETANLQQIVSHH